MKHSLPENALGLLVSDESRLVKELRNLKSQRSPRQVRVAKALKALEETQSSRVRNAAALALVDLGGPSAKDALVILLRRPDTEGSRGTLLYALDHLRADVPLSILAEIIIKDTYEAREEALRFIKHDRIECSTEEFGRAQRQLETALPAATGDRQQAIRQALEYLSAKHY